MTPLKCVIEHGWVLTPYNINAVNLVWRDNVMFVIRGNTWMVVTPLLQVRDF